MTLYKATVADILEMVSDYRGESTTDTSARRVRAVSRSEQSIARRLLWQLFILPNQTTTGSGVNSYTLGSATNPARLKGLSEVFVDGTLESNRYDVVDYHQFKKLYNENNSSRMVYQWYDSVNDLWKMYINPAPESGVTITYSYFWLPPERTSTTDSVYCVNLEALARDACGELLMSEDERDEGREEKALAEQIINEEMGWENTPHVNQHYAMGSYVSADKPRSIGNY
jgi:hypothetical protein